MSGSKNTAILYRGNPDTQTQTEAVMRVKYEMYICMKNLFLFKHCIPDIELGHTHRHFKFFSMVSISEVFGRPATHPDEPARYPERFQEPMHPRDYQHAAEEFSDSHSSAPSLVMEQAWMDRGPRPRYSNLDKITSTLLELVGRK